MGSKPTGPGGAAWADQAGTLAWAHWACVRAGGTSGLGQVGLGTVGLGPLGLGLPLWAWAFGPGPGLCEPGPGGLSHFGSGRCWPGSRWPWAPWAWALVGLGAGPPVLCPPRLSLVGLENVGLGPGLAKLGCRGGPVWPGWSGWAHWAQAQWVWARPGPFGPGRCGVGLGPLGLGALGLGGAGLGPVGLEPLGLGHLWPWGLAPPGQRGVPGLTVPGPFGPGRWWPWVRSGLGQFFSSLTS